jgi:hypothetical protein
LREGEVNLDHITRDDWIIGGLALLLAIDLLFLPWFSISASVGSVTLSASSTATGSPDGWLGVLALLVDLALLADLAVERFSPQTRVPALQNSRVTTRFALACLVAFFLVLKFVFHIHFSLFGFGFYLAVILTAALVFFTLQARRTQPALAAQPAGPGPAGPGPAGPGPAGPGPAGPPVV